MKLLYGRAVLIESGLNVPDPGDYNIDTFQLKNLHTGTNVSKVNDEVDSIDGFFTGDPDFILSFTPDNDPYMDSGSGIGYINRDPWYDNPGSPFYADLEDIFDAVKSEHGSRFKGMRWNHEIRPVSFREGTKWENYAEDNASTDYREVRDYRQTEWGKYKELAQNHGRDAYQHVGEADEDPYDTAVYAAVRRLYTHFVDFQCKAQARMVDIMAQKIGSSRKIIFYPVQRGPIVYGVSEYAVDFRKVTQSNVIGEIGTWDLDRQTNQNRRDWASDQGTQPYFFALQHDRNDRDNPGDIDFSAHRTARLNSIISTYRNPSGAENPYGDYFAFWSKWNSGSKGDPLFSDAEMRSYMQQVRDALD